MPNSRFEPNPARLDGQLTCRGNSGTVRRTMRRNVLSWTVLLCLAGQLNAQNPPATATTRPISLSECIQLALERNLSIQVGEQVRLADAPDMDRRTGGRLGLEVARLQLSEAYGYYDPQVSGSAGQHYRKQTGGIDPVFGPLSGGDNWNEDFSLGIRGILPTGTRYNIGGSVNRLSGTTLDRDPLSPTFQEFVNLSWQYRSDAGITITQPLLRDFWIDGGRLNIKLLKSQVKISEHLLELLLMDIVQRVAIAYFDLVAARDQIKVQTKALELAQQLVSENKKKVAVGNMAPLDERQAESQQATSKAELTRVTYDVQAAENVLKTLITGDFGEIQATTLEPTDKLLAVFQAFSLPESWRLGLEQRPDYLIAKQEVEERNIVLQYLKNQLFPALDLEGTYQRNGLGASTSESLDAIGDNRFPTYGGALVLRFPLTFRSERDAYKRGKVQRQAELIRLKRVENEVLREIDDALKLVRSAYAATEATREARRFAEEALDAEQKKLEVGKSTSFQILQFQRDLTTAAAQEILALAEYNKALHQTYFREGTILQRSKISIDLR
jgi:outer membrane protein TolC